MENNRQTALEWWNSKSEHKKEFLANYYFSRHFGSLTDRNIEHIYTEEVLNVDKPLIERKRVFGILECLATGYTTEEIDNAVFSFRKQMKEVRGGF